MLAVIGGDTEWVVTMAVIGKDSEGVVVSILARHPWSCCDKVSVFILVFYSKGTSFSTRDNCQWVQERWCVLLIPLPSVFQNSI